MIVGSVPSTNQPQGLTEEEVAEMDRTELKETESVAQLEGVGQREAESQLSYDQSVFEEPGENYGIELSGSCSQ